MSLEAFLHSSIHIEHSFNIIICSNTWICREIHAKADSMFFFFEEIRFHSSWSSWANSEYIDIVFIRFAMNIGISSLPSVPNLKVSKVQNTHFFCWKYLFNKNRLKPYKPYIEKNLARKGVTVPIYLLLFNRLHFEGFNIKEFIINHVFNHVSW